MFTFVKQPAETYTIAVEFSGQLPTGATLSSGVFSARDPTGADVTGTVLFSPTASIVGTQARATVQGGVHGTQYRLRLVATLSSGAILEQDGLMSVENL